MNIEMNIDSYRPKNRKSRPSTANILVLGDFSGKDRPDVAIEANAEIRNMFTLDPNQLDAAVARVAPTLEMTLGSATAGLKMKSMDSFHPDELLKMDALRTAASPVTADSVSYTHLTLPTITE